MDGRNARLAGQMLESAEMLRGLDALYKAYRPVQSSLLDFALCSRRLEQAAKLVLRRAN